MQTKGKDMTVSIIKATEGIKKYFIMIKTTH